MMLMMATAFDEFKVSDALENSGRFSPRATRSFTNGTVIDITRQESLGLPNLASLVIQPSPPPPPEVLEDPALVSRRSASISEPKTLDIGTATSTGNRYASLNQDYVVAQEFYTKGELSKGSLQAYVVAVCDGHGILGDKAACFAGKALARHVYSSNLRHKNLSKVPVKQVQDEMKAAFRRAHEASCLVYDMPPKRVQYPASTGSAKLSDFELINVGSCRVYRNGKGCEKILECGTTCTAAILQGGTVCIANVGDSQAVIGRDDPVRGLTSEVVTVRHHGLLASEASRIKRNHNDTTQVLEDGYIKIRNGEWVGYELAVTRALGHKNMEPYGVSPEPDCRMLHLDGHCCLVIGSDGIWDVMGPDEAVAYVMDGKAAKGWTAAQAARSLVDTVVSRGMASTPAPGPDFEDEQGEQDNTSAIVVFFGSPSLT